MSFATCLITGCQAPKAMSPRESGAIQSTRNNGYSLLHQLLTEQNNVSLLRFIRPEHTDTKELVKKIATTSGAGAALLEKFAKDDPTISLDDIRLPPAELATRNAIATTKKKELLSQSGNTFELTLLLTQTEALCYAWHLADVTAQKRIAARPCPCAGWHERRHEESVLRSVRVVAFEIPFRADKLHTNPISLASVHR